METSVQVGYDHTATPDVPSAAGMRMRTGKTAGNSGSGNMDHELMKERLAKAAAAQPAARRRSGRHADA